MRRRVFLSGLAAAAGAGALAGCGGGSGAGGAGEPTSGTLKVAYQKFGNFTSLDKLLTDLKPVFESANSGWTLELIPIEAQQNDYFTKLALMNRSPNTAPDVIYQDTYMIRSDVEAGYLAPLDDYLNGWSDWSKFIPASKQAGLADDGKTYGVPLGTDTRGLWFNKDLLAKADLPKDWAPKSWEEIISAARAIKQKVPGVIPFTMYSGKPMGEASVMQGFEMLLYGTGASLYDTEQQKWVTGSGKFVESLEFVKTIFTEGLGPTPQQALDTNASTIVAGDWFPEEKLAIALDGSWLCSSWLDTGEASWPEWSSKIGTAAMPTQTGAAPGRVSMSGGWTLAVGASCKAPATAFKLISLATDQQNALRFATTAGDIAVRSDVADQPSYQKANPTVPFWTELVEVTHYRPATADYPPIANAIMVAMESVMTGQSSPAEAAAVYDKAVVDQVGQDKTVAG